MKFTTDDLQFDDEATEFGAVPDFDMSFDLNNDRLELEDRDTERGLKNRAYPRIVRKTDEIIQLLNKLPGPETVL
jgi:hypothetical protein